jgi:hypothetical protein
MELNIHLNSGQQRINRFLLVIVAVGTKAMERMFYAIGAQKY